jgi:predicted aminopeptidase
MRAEYERLKVESKNAPAFDRWFAAGANNAGIVAVGLYTDLVPQFMALIQAEGGDLRRFYVRVDALAALPKADRDAALGGEHRQEPSRTDRIAPLHLP